MVYDQDFVSGIQDLACAGLAAEDADEKDDCLSLIESSCRHGHLVWNEEERQRFSGVFQTSSGRFYREKEPPHGEIVVLREEPVEGDPGTKLIYYRYVDAGIAGSALFRNFHRQFEPRPDPK